jgi:hypothetical protein
VENLDRVTMSEVAAVLRRGIGSMRFFVETSGFTRWVSESWSDDALARLQRDLLNDTDKGDVIPGCGGLRKLRVAEPRRGKGKRGGARVIYLHVPEARVIFLVHVYDKGEKEDLTATEKRILKDLAAVSRREAMAWTERSRRGRKG